jgi:hypothetical protein
MTWCLAFQVGDGRGRDLLASFPRSETFGGDELCYVFIRADTLDVGSSYVHELLG